MMTCKLDGELLLIRKEKFKAMKLRLLFILVAALIWGCDHATLFSPNENEKLQEPLNGPSGQSVIEMQISGGFAGVNQQLLVDANRYVRYADLSGQTGQREKVLSMEDFNRLVTLFIEKDFLHLDPRYVDPYLADAFHYRIVFRHGGADNQVETDYESAPPELRALVDQLRGLIDGLRQSTPALEFNASADTLRHGDKLTLTLTAINRSDETLTLQTGGQKFDFFVALPNVRAAAFPQTFVWNWAHDKAFIAIVESVTLQPGESRAYTAEWDGRDNEGNLVEGEFWLGARLVAQPGGYSPLRRVVVTK